MSQHDYVIDNSDGLTVRNDINSVLAAIQSVNSGTTAPTVTVAYMFWADTAGTSLSLKQRNGADTDWITKNVLAATGEILIGPIIVGDETTAITTGIAKLTFRMPFSFALTEVRASLTTASSSGIPTFDINESGASILSTKITIDVNEKTSQTAAVPPVISDVILANDAEMTIDIDVTGTGAAGLKIYLIGFKI